MSALLTVKDLTVAFRQDGQLSEAVRGVSFTVDRGETVALVGESGSGKSVTALSSVSLLGSSAVTGGSITYEGQEMVGADEALLRKVRGNDISFIFQEPMTSLNPMMSIGDQVAEPIWHHKGVSKSSRNLFPVVDAKINLVGIVSLDSIRDVMFDQSLHETTSVETFMRNPLDIIIYEKDTMQQVMRKFQNSGAWNLPVLKNDTYYGFVSKSKLLTAYRRELINFTS